MLAAALGGTHISGPFVQRTNAKGSSFVSTVLLRNNVPMEIVSELLGHSSMKITQEYNGKIVQKRVSEEMVRVSRKLKRNELSNLLLEASIT